LVFDHPPNKAELVNSGGVEVVIKALDASPLEESTQKQGLALLFYLLSDDNMGKYSIRKARTSAVVHGVVSVIKRAQKNFKDVADITDPCRSLIQVLTTELS
jgi:hypothetical protein